MEHRPRRGRFNGSFLTVGSFACGPIFEQENTYDRRQEPRRGRRAARDRYRFRPPRRQGRLPCPLGRAARDRRGSRRHDDPRGDAGEGVASRTATSAKHPARRKEIALGISDDFRHLAGPAAIGASFVLEASGALAFWAGVFGALLCSRRLIAGRFLFGFDRRHPRTWSGLRSTKCNAAGAALIRYWRVKVNERRIARVHSLVTRPGGRSCPIPGTISSF